VKIDPKETGGLKMRHAIPPESQHFLLSIFYLFFRNKSTSIFESSSAAIGRSISSFTEERRPRTSVPGGSGALKEITENVQILPGSKQLTGWSRALKCTLLIVHSRQRVALWRGGMLRGHREHRLLLAQTPEVTARDFRKVLAELGRSLPLEWLWGGTSLGAYY